MHESLRIMFAQPFVVRWLATSTHSWQQLPIPTGPLVIRAIGVNPDHVLLVGVGISVGYGAVSHDLALAGQLAGQLSEHTGRGAVVTVLTKPHLSQDDVSAALTATALASFDAIVATPGDFETLFMRSPAHWRAEIESIIAAIVAVAPASLHFFIVGIPELPDIVRMPRFLGFLAGRSARALNAELELACESRKNTTYIRFKPAEMAGRTETGSTYLRWAKIIATSVAAAFDSDSLDPLGRRRPA